MKECHILENEKSANFKEEVYSLLKWPNIEFDNLRKRCRMININWE